jgi:DNA adenine methylase
MILRRLGNKQAIAHKILPYFPAHEIYIEPFFGAGGMFFNKPKAKYNILNDLDSDVFNLFDVVVNYKTVFLELLELTPYSSELFEHWKINKETEPLKKALRFIYLSNFSFLGKETCIRMDTRNHKENALLNLNKTILFLKDCSLKFTNNDFRKAIKSISLSEENNIAKAFFYCDPPYLGTNDNYSNSFKEQDCIDLFDFLQDTGCKFAMSEFDNEFVLNQAKERGLNVIIIGERKNIKNRRTEILITNYEKQKSLFD